MWGDYAKSLIEVRPVPLPGSGTVGYFAREVASNRCFKPSNSA